MSAKCFSCRASGGTLEHVFDGAVVVTEMTDFELSEALREASSAVDRAEAHRLAVAAEWDRRQVWAGDGAYSGRCWLATECTLSRAEAAATPRTARVVASALVVAQAVADGALPVAKAEVLASVVTARTAERFVEDQQVLVDEADRLSVDELAKMARWWQRLADQDGSEPAEPDNQLRMTQASDGTVHLRGVLDAEGGAQVRTVLEAIADQLWRAERAGTGDERERPPVGAGARLRAEALVEMAGRATAADPDRTGARPLIGVVIDLPTLEGRAGRPAMAEDGEVLSPEAVRRLACDARIARILTGPDGAILDLGRAVRTATADQWRLLRLRDRGCTWPGCDRPAGGVRPTTSSGGKTMGTPTWPTSRCSVRFTTTRSTTVDGPSNASTTAGSVSPAPMAEPSTALRLHHLGRCRHPHPGSTRPTPRPYDNASAISSANAAADLTDRSSLPERHHVARRRRRAPAPQLPSVRDRQQVSSSQRSTVSQEADRAVGK